MATFIGSAGKFQSDKALNRRLRVLMVLFIGLAIICFLSGYLTAKFHLLWFILAIVVVAPAYRMFLKHCDKQLRISRMESDGAWGEQKVVNVLETLPDTYTVISDFEFLDSYGNIDHLIIGPTGIFAIDVKNWKGTVSSDSNGELLLNGKPTDKPMVRSFVRRVMDLRERLMALTHCEPYIQALIVFVHSYLEVKWNDTGAADCVGADKLVNYVTRVRQNKMLAPDEISRLVKASKALQETAAKVTPES